MESYFIIPQVSGLPKCLLNLLFFCLPEVKYSVWVGADFRSRDNRSGRINKG